MLVSRHRKLVALFLHNGMSVMSMTAILFYTYQHLLIGRASLSGFEVCDDLFRQNIMVTIIIVIRRGTLRLCWNSRSTFARLRTSTTVSASRDRRPCELALEDVLSLGPRMLRSFPHTPRLWTSSLTRRCCSSLSQRSLYTGGSSRNEV